VNESSYAFKFIYVLKCFAGFQPESKLMWSENQSIQTIRLVNYSSMQKKVGSRYRTHPRLLRFQKLKETIHIFGNYFDIVKVHLDKVGAN